MNKKELIKVIQNYKRNKKRIEEIQEGYYSISAYNYSSMPGSSESRDKNADKIHAFYNNKERQRLQHLVNAVDRMKLRLTEREEKILQLFIIKKNSVKKLEQEGYSKTTLFRYRDNILCKLKEELEG